MGRRRIVTLAIGVLLLFASCTSTDTVEVNAEVDAAAFCASWPETRAALQTDIGGTEEWQLRPQVEEIHRALDLADGIVPTSIQSEWATATRFQKIVIKLLEIADFRPERLPAVLIDAAFGESGADAAMKESVAAMSGIDGWAVDECGDICEVWPRLLRSLGWAGFGGGDTEQSIVNNAARDRSLIQLADPLIPDAIRSNWEAASDLKLALIDLYASVENWGAVDHEELRQRHLAIVGFTDNSLGSLLDQLGEWPEGDPTWWVTDFTIGSDIDPMSVWIADNCDSLGTSGAPGTVAVVGSSPVTDTLFMAAVPSGASLDEIADASDFLATTCVGQLPDAGWEVLLLGRTGGFDAPCVWLGLEGNGVEEAVLPAGGYDLFVGSFPIGVGNFDIYVPAPERCAVVPFTVDGDVRIDLPPLKPCGLGPFAGSPEEIARRQLDHGDGPTGTLRVSVTEYLREPDSDVFYRLFVLPHGTTLNQLAHGEVWPLGFGCLGVEPGFSQHLDRQRERDEAMPDFDLDDGISVPMLPVPAVPDGDGCPGGAWEYLGLVGPEWIPPAVAALPIGDYDLRAMVETWNPETDESLRLCTMATVSIAGDTTLTLPPLEECP